MVKICVRLYSCQILYQILNNFSRSDDPSSPLGAERRFRSVESPLNPQGRFQSEAEKERKKWKILISQRKTLNSKLSTLNYFYYLCTRKSEGGCKICPSTPLYAL